MADLEKLAQELTSLDVNQLVAFKKILKDKHGLEEPTAVVASVVEEVKEKVAEKTEFKVLLTKVSEVTAEKLNAVKVVNKILNVGLKAAMDLIKEPPVILKEVASKEEAETIRAEFAALNAEIELK